MPRTKKLPLKRLEQLHPIEREKELRKVLLENKNKKFLRIINEEIEKAEEEQEHSASLEKIPKKETKEKEPEGLSTLVKKEAEELEENKKEKIRIGKVYGVKEEHRENKYSTYTVYSPHKENIKVEITSTQSAPANPPEINTAEESIKKTTELYLSKNKKREKHEH